MKILIKNGRVIDPANKIDDVLDILVDGEHIARVGKNIPGNVDQTIDATGKIIMPGIVDMHVHLREPGREDKETVASGTKAALKGGVTSVLAMPNTLPAMDSVDIVEKFKSIIQKTAHANVYICAAITKGRLGKEATDIVELKQAGVIAISDDGGSVGNEEIFLEAMKKARENNVLVLCHSEDKSLSRNGVVNLGYTSTRLGLIGISRESEYKCVARDIDLAVKAKAAVHITHVSCRESVEIIAQAKKKDIAVTCDTAPHYFSLTEEEVLDYDTNMKINPPLRGKEDVAAIKEGLRNGTIDAIASDHAPHTDNEKDVEFERAEFGAIGLETELAVGITELIASGLLNWADLVEKMSFNPARILRLNKGTLSVGADADIVIVSPDDEWVVKKDDFWSKSKNSSFIGRRLKGLAVMTIYRGKVVYQAVDLCNDK